MSDKSELKKVFKENIDQTTKTYLGNLRLKLLNISIRILEYVDYSIDFITQEKTKLERSDVVQIARKPILFGVWVCFITFVVCGLWAGFAPLNSAVVASGLVSVASQRKTIQHLEGGIVSKILVKDGDIVQKGQTLIVLDDKRARAALDNLLVQVRSAKATQARLIAESEEKNEIDFSEDIKNSNDEEIIKIRNTQERFFKTKMSALHSRINTIEKRIEQHKKQISSYNAQLKSNKLQQKYNNDQLDSIQQLIDKGQATKPKLLELQSRYAAYEGTIGDIEAKIAQAYSAISGEEVEIISAKISFLNDAIKELKDVQIQIAANEEEIKSRRDTLNRTNITSPQDGIVHNLVIHTIGGVIPAGGHSQPLLEIIPQNDELVIDAQVRQQDIDLISKGLHAQIKLSAFKSRTNPSLEGIVDFVPAETTNSPRGEIFYKVRITISPDQFSKKELKDIRPYPGMHANVFIITGTRSLLRYILDPVIDSMKKAFRER